MGQFSWFTQDDNSQIVDDKVQDTYMIDPRDGTQYKEECYKGYGVFGGRDYYELFADINKDIILKRNIKNWKNFSKDFLYQYLLGKNLESKMTSIKNHYNLRFNESKTEITLDDFKKLYVLEDYLKTRNYPDVDNKKIIEDMDINYCFTVLFNEYVYNEIESVKKTDNLLVTIFSKDWKELNENEINSKRMYGIDLWYDNENNSDFLLYPVLLRKPTPDWLRYIHKRPVSDPNQGWDCELEDEI